MYRVDIFFAVYMFSYCYLLNYLLQINGETSFNQKYFVCHLHSLLFI